MTHYSNPLLITLALVFCCSFCSSPEKVDEKATEKTGVDTEQARFWTDSAQALMYRHYDWAGADAAFQKAIAFDPDFGRAHTQYSWLKSLQGDANTAIEEAEKGLASQPENATWHAWHAWLLWWYNEKDKALASLDRALEIDSAHVGAKFIKGSILAERGESEEAIQLLVEAAAVNPTFQAWLGVAYSHLGQEGRARKIAAALSQGNEQIDPMALAELYAVLGETDRALDWMEKAHQQRSEFLPWAHQVPNLQVLKDQPRFIAIMRDLGIPGV